MLKKCLYFCKEAVIFAGAAVGLALLCLTYGALYYFVTMFPFYF